MNYLTITAGTVIIILFSWFLSIKHKRYHGIPRFFAFESIFLLTFLNIKIWFHNPFSFLQIISWIFLCLSAFIAIAGFMILKIKGKPAKNFEATTVLVKTNIYGYIRHPLYLSLLLLGTGIMLKDPGVSRLILCAINLIALYITARIEEKEMTGRFGEAYTEYIKETKMFIPFVL